MRTRFNDRLKSIARREVGAALAEDVVQDALLVAIEQGRVDLDDVENQRWLCGVVRNRARMAARGARRSQHRDRLWQQSRPEAQAGPDLALPDILEGLPPALRTLAALVLTGHNRREIAWLLRLPDTALRQRVSALRRHLVAKGLSTPGELTGLHLDLAYGRIRDALLPALLRHGGSFASHDPDGHLFVVRSSQNAPPRQ
jgi:DNA-directed RNA polymerase specialized sigma24 family protein